MTKKSNNYQQKGKVAYLAQAKKKTQAKENSGRHSFFLKLFLFIFLAFAGFLFSAQYFQHTEAKNELKELEEQLSDLEEETGMLEKEVELLHDEDYLKMQARKHLGMVRPGEIIFHVGE